MRPRLKAVLIFILPFNFIFDFVGLVGRFGIYNTSAFEIWSTDIGFIIGYCVSSFFIPFWLGEEDGRVVLKFFSHRTGSSKNLALWSYLIGIFMGSVVEYFLNFNDNILLENVSFHVVSVLLLTLAASFSVVKLFIQEGWLDKIFQDRFPFNIPG